MFVYSNNVNVVVANEWTEAMFKRCGRGVDCEGGWGVNTFYAVNPALYTPGYGFHSSAMGDITPKDAIEHPLFTPFRTEADSMHSTNLFTIADQCPVL